MQHMQYVHLVLFINNYYSSLVAYYVYISHVHAGLHTGFFYGGGTHISAASRGSGGMLPQKIFCILRWTLT